MKCIVSARESFDLGNNSILNCCTFSSGTAVGVVIYTGSETRSVMNTSNPETKVLATCPQ